MPRLVCSIESHAMSRYYHHGWRLWRRHGFCSYAFSPLFSPLGRDQSLCPISVASSGVPGSSEVLTVCCMVYAGFRFHVLLALECKSLDVGSVRQLNCELMRGRVEASVLSFPMRPTVNE